MELEIFAYDKTEVFLQPETEIEEIVQNVKTILQTVKNTVGYDRDFGISGQLVDRPTEVVKAKLSGQIVESVAKFEPRARVTDIKYKATLDGRFEPIVRIKIVERNLRGEL